MIAVGGSAPRVSAVAADRDAALAAARGEYVWFVEPGARLPRARSPAWPSDCARSRPTSCSWAAGTGGLLARVGRDGVTSLDERPGLAAAAPGLAGKVFRRAHVTALGLGFGAGEPGVTWPALLAAERVAAAPDARVFAPEAPDELADYDAVFAFLAAHPELPDARRRLVLPAILATSWAGCAACPASGRAARFAALSELWRRHRRGDEVLREHADALTRGSYAEYRALEALRGGRRAIGRGKRRAGRIRARRARAAAWSAATRAARRAPVDPQARAVRRLLVPRLRLQPARDLREGARARARHARRVGGQARGGRRRCPPGVEYVVRRHARVLRRDRPRAACFVNNVNFPNHLVKRAGHRARDDPPRHAAEDDGARPARDADRRRPDGLRRAAAALRALGLQRVLQPVLERDLGARVPDRLRVARGRLPAQRRAGERGARGCRARPRRAGDRARPDGGALRADAPRVPRLVRPGARPRPRWRTRSATATCCSPGAHYFYGADPRARGAARARGGSATSPRIRRSSSSAWPPTCWSPTTRRSCSTTRCWTGRS